MTEKTMQEKYKLLREPLTANDIEVRVGTVGEKGVTLLLYKTARVDTKRFDEIFGGRWKREHYIDGKGSVVCKISIYDTELKEWISREDVGSESNTEKEKGAYSDSLKRAGSAWGSGIELYDAPFIFVKCETIGKGEKNQYGKYKSYELKEKFYFNDITVTKFESINSEVFVEIKKNNDLLFSNFNKQSENKHKPISDEKKQEPQKQNISVSFETLKDYLRESPSKERLEALWKRGESHIAKYTIEQQTEIKNIYNNKLSELCTK